MTDRFRARIDITPVAVVPLAMEPPQGCSTSFLTAEDAMRRRGPYLRWVVEAREAVQTIEVTHRAMAAILAELAERGWPEDPPRPPPRKWEPPSAEKHGIRDAFMWRGAHSVLDAEDYDDALAWQIRRLEAELADLRKR